MRPSLPAILFALALVAPLAPVALAPAAWAQAPPPAEERGPGIRFNGLGRGFIQQVDLGGDLLAADSLSARRLADGSFLLDLAVNGQPNAVTEVQGVLRLRNEFGGFFGEGVTVEVRELWARGIVADVLRYRVGDMDLALTPYTLFLSDEDGTVNEPEIFRPQKEIIYYEQFYTGLNERRFQGAELDFGLGFDQVIESADVRAFVARLRTTNFTNLPSRYIGGGRVGVASPQIGPYGSRGRAGANLAHTWDDLRSGNANAGIFNTVLTFDADVTLVEEERYAVRLLGEAGRSIAQRRARVAGTEDEYESLVRDADTFVEIGLAGRLAGPALDLGATFVNVGPDFFSGAAQSKRLDYARPRSLYNRIGNDRRLRGTTLFDLTRDPSLYTFRVADQLMPYDPRYNNALPYGRATPNRRGLRLEAAYAPPRVPVQAALTGAALREIRGQGTTELKDFLLLRAEAETRVNEFVGWRRALTATFGMQAETTRRGGVEVEQVDLSSTLAEAGLSVEVYDRLDVLLGAKWRASDGRDYVPLIENFNDVRDFPAPFVVDDREALLGAGLRYRFTPGAYVTLQLQRFSYSDAASPAEAYRFNQVFALYSMSF